MKSLNIRFLCLCISFSLTSIGLVGCISSHVSQIPGHTLADATLKRDTYLNIRTNELACQGTRFGNSLIPGDPEIIDTVVAKPPGSATSPWTEKWTVKRNGGTATYTIVYQPEPQNGTDIMIAFPPEVAP
jgi:hypothetical protein